MQVPPGNYIEAIRVERLYGEFNYLISNTVEGVDPRVLIIYGDNGTGKTTILRLLRSLLSPRDNVGHRTRLGRIPFKRFEVRFRDGLVISAVRERQIEGSYLLSIHGGGEGAGVRTYVHVDPSDGVRAETWSKSELAQFQKYIERLGQVSSEVGFLDDKRTFVGSDFREQSQWKSRYVIQDKVLEVPGAASGDPVAEAVSDLLQSIRREALLRQRRGSGDAQSIYQNLIARIGRGQSSYTPTTEVLIARLRETEVLAAEFSRMGLIQTVQHEDMVSLLKTASPDRSDIVHELVAGYVSSTEALFDALKELIALIEVFVERLNYFMSPKKVVFTISDGLSFFSSSGQPLTASSLSSGERHLVMMLTQALFRRSNASLLVIDEPELSLNVKWQRELVSSILSCIGGSASQVILATHSIEIAAKYRNNVFRLWPTEARTDETHD